MTDTNVVTVVGRLTKDAELKHNTGLPIGFFTIATNRKKKNQGDNYVVEASYFNVTTYGNYAELIIPRLKKGKTVCVVGSLKQERWKEASTKNQIEASYPVIDKSRVVITADSIQILGNKSE